MTVFKKGLLLFAAVAVMTGLVGCEGPECKGPECGDPFHPPSNVLIFDDFRLHDGDSVYTIQNVIGNNLGQFKAFDTVGHGGGQWYAYASKEVAGQSEAATVYTYISASEIDTIVKLGAGVPVSPKTDPAVMFGDSTLSVVLDARDAAKVENGGYYYAAVACPIGGDATKLTNDDNIGATLVPNVKTDADTLETIVTWDLTALESIALSGQAQGAFKIVMGGVARDTSFTAFYEYPQEKVTIDELSDFNLTIPVSEFKKASWMGATWEDIKAQVNSLAIEINTEANPGGDFLSLKLNEIEFVFTDYSAKEQAFPFAE